jgi:enoyl-CoA hydratase
MSNIIKEKQGKTRILKINRPEQLNALNKQTISELGDAIIEAEVSQEVATIIITGTGEKAFVAGADIKEFHQYSVEEAKALAADGHLHLFNRVEHTRKPVIAAINGFALGGGLELAMSCHIRIASKSAKMGLPEVSLGVIPGYGGTQRLPQLVGKGKAMEMIFTGGMIGAEEALQAGLVNQVVEADQLMDTALALCEKIQKNSIVAIGHAISAINYGYQDGVNGLDKEIELFSKCFTTSDFKEGTDAFLNKRKPEFSGS